MELSGKSISEICTEIDFHLSNGLENNSYSCYDDGDNDIVVEIYANNEETLDNILVITTVMDDVIKGMNNVDYDCDFDLFKYRKESNSIFTYRFTI